MDAHAAPLYSILFPLILCGSIFAYAVFVAFLFTCAHPSFEAFMCHASHTTI